MPTAREDAPYLDPDTLVGLVVDGRYHVRRHLADGGMGSVYVALDTRLDREVALKVMRRDLGRDPAFAERFRREARATAQLSHPNVVSVYDQGEEGGTLFLAMEYVRGPTLRTRLAEVGALTPREAVEVLDGMLRALTAAHRAGIVHRDVKPENVLIAEDGTIKVADFGLARAVSTHTATAHGPVLGTVAYLAPEQVELGVADARSDVYATGLVLYEMLTGHRAVPGDSPIQVAYQHVHGEIPPPSQQVPGLPAELDALVQWATQRRPEDRPADASAFLAQLTGSRAALRGDIMDRRPRMPDVATATGLDATSTVALPMHTAVIPLTAGYAGTPDAGMPRLEGTPAGYDRQSGARRGSQAAPRRPRRWPKVLLAFLTTLALALGGTAWYVLAGPGAARAVPPLVGKTQSAAVVDLQTHDLHPRVVEAFSETVAKGKIIGSVPASGAEVRRGDTVELTVSKGRERYKVPGIVGRSLEEARTLIRQAKLKTGAISQRYDEKVPQGSVISADPTVGTSLKPGTTVALIVSQGRQPIELTDWTGRSWLEAQSELKNKGLVAVVEREEVNANVAVGAVVSQNPATGTLYRGDQVTFVISKGPELVAVPDVVGKEENEATTVLQQAGFTVQVSRSWFTPPGTTVRSTDPAAGSQVPQGSTVTVQIG